LWEVEYAIHSENVSSLHEKGTPEQAILQTEALF